MRYGMEHPIYAEIGTTKYQTTIEWRNGKIISDEPAKMGGADSGPDPYTLLLASVASCTLVTLRMYIDHKEWDIPRIGVNVNIHQVRKEDRMVTIIDRDIKVPQPLTDEQRERITEIAQACPVSKMLEGEIQMRTYTGDLSAATPH